MQVGRLVVAVLLAAPLLPPVAAAEASLTATPDYLRLSSQRTYAMEVRLDADWACDHDAAPPRPVTVGVSPEQYSEELGLVFSIEPSNAAFNWTASTSAGRPVYAIHEVMAVAVRRVGQPFEDRQFNGQWWARDIRLGSDCAVTDDERANARSDLWQSFKLDVPVIEDTHEPQNSPDAGAAALLLAVAAVAWASRARRTR